MSLEVTIPPVGESINEVTIASWTKSSGDYVEKDEIICELESDKATFELNAEQAGTLEIIVEEGETVDIGTLICKIDTAASGGSSSGSSQQKAEGGSSSSSQSETATAEADSSVARPLAKCLKCGCRLWANRSMR